MCACMQGKELTIHLYKQFRLDPPTGLVFTVTASLTANGVNLINKDCAGGIVPCLYSVHLQCTECPHVTYNTDKIQVHVHVQVHVQCI